MAVKTAEKGKQRQMFLLDRAKKRSSQFASLHPHVDHDHYGTARLRGPRQRRLALGELRK